MKNDSGYKVSPRTIVPGQILYKSCNVTLSWNKHHNCQQFEGVQLDWVLNPTMGSKHSYEQWEQISTNFHNKIWEFD